MACGGLKWANPVWECSECMSILGKELNFLFLVKFGESNCLIDSRLFTIIGKSVEIASSSRTQGIVKYVSVLFNFGCY